MILVWKVSGNTMSGTFFRVGKSGGVLLVVTAIEKFGKYKYKVFVDYEFAFWAYWKDLQYWNIKENQNISVDTYEQFLNEVVLEKAKRKAISLLKYMNRTEQELRQKLKLQLYPLEVIDETIAYVESYHYLDDDWYIENFIACNQKTHSQRWIEMKLTQKGIEKEKIQEYFMEGYSEEDALRKAIKKKVKGKKIGDEKERQKILAYLFRQGFSVKNARQVLNEYVKDATV